MLGNEVARSFKNTLKAIKDNTFFINDNEYDRAHKEESDLNNTVQGSSPDAVKSVAKTALNAQRKVIKIFKIFKNFSNRYDLSNDFAFIFVNKHFESNYAKLGNEEIYIEFNPNRVIQLKMLYR